MRLITRGALGYAVLLIILFAIATIAVWQTLAYIEEQISLEQYKIVMALIWALTLGFMLIAGAFGIWAIQFSVEAESRRRIGRLVDAMDYLRDGLLAVDRKGRITGSNPAAAKIVGSTLTKHESIEDVFTCLSKEDVSLLLSTKEPNEVERKLVSANISRILRFRSQPSEGLTLVLVSDVTTLNAQRRRSRQIARLQLIGQLARGVAHDFNNLLSVISGHASLLTRLQPDSSEMANSVEAITQSTDKGIALAGHLLELTQPAIAGRSTDMVEEHVRTAVESLRNSLPATWKVESTFQDQLPAVALTGIQIEQVVLNLGLLAADALNEPGILKITVAKPNTNHLFNVDSRFAGVILITTAGPSVTARADETIVRETSRESGVIQSVIRSMLEESGGTLDCLTGNGGSPIYRVCLPRGIIITSREEAGELAGELGDYIADWTILLAKRTHQHSPLDKRLDELKVKVERVDNITSVLARVEEARKLDAMILDKYLLGKEAAGLLKAIVKLHPTAGIIVLCEDAELEIAGLPPDVISLPAHSDPNSILMSMIEAKTLAVRRKKA